jgi:hypothetical protein
MSHLYKNIRFEDINQLEINLHPVKFIVEKMNEYFFCKTKYMEWKSLLHDVVKKYPQLVTQEQVKGCLGKKLSNNKIRKDIYKTLCRNR